MDAEVSNPNNNFSKKPFNKNIILAILGVVALIALIVYFQYKNRPKPTEESPYLVQEETDTGNQNNEPFSNIDIDGDGDEEQVPREIVESEILMLTENNELYIISPVDKEKKLLLQGVSSYASSNDKNYIAYLKTGLYLKDQKQSDNFIHIYNISTQQESQIASDQGTQRGISWSPDDRYVIVESGTGTVGSNKVYSVETGKETGCVFQGDILWINSVELFAPEFPGTYPLASRNFIDAEGIRKINIENCQSETFISPTATANFSAVKIIDNDLVVKKYYVEKPEDWNNMSAESMPKTTYEKYNLQTKQSTPYPEYADEIKSEMDRLEALIPFTVRVKRVFTTDKDVSSEWELVNAYKGGSIYNNEIYLIGPDKTVVKIGENAFATWL